MLAPFLALVVAQTSSGPMPVADATHSLSNVKQLGLAMLMYAQDHKDTLPEAKNFRSALMPYLKNPAVFTAPGAPAGETSYFMEPRLSGLQFKAIARPAETAAIVEGKAGKAVYPYRGRAAVGFVDGHAKLLDTKAATAARSISLK